MGRAFPAPEGAGEPLPPLCVGLTAGVEPGFLAGPSGLGCRDENPPW